MEKMRAFLKIRRPDPGIYAQIRLLIAQYAKLRVAHRWVITECYETFERYVREKILWDRSPAAMAILASREFREILTLVHERTLEHPKVQQFIALQQSMQEMGWLNLTFCYLQEVARHLQKKLSEACVPAEVVFGGGGRNIGRQMEVLRDLGARKIQSLISTDVLREGANVPELNAVIHYLIPQSPIAMIQGNGRVSRTYPGHAIFLAMDHPLDKLSYFRTHARTLAMKTFVKGETPTEAAQPPRRRRVRRYNPSQFSLSLIPNL
jgi:ERCC4-related helicase